MADRSEDAATAAAQEMLGTEEAPEGESSGTENEGDLVSFPNFSIELPPDLAAELEEFDESDLEVTDDEMNALTEQYGEESSDLARRALAAEKRAAHLETLRVNEAKKNWQEEAKKFFPLAEPFLGEINQSSRRGYLRTARQIHDKMLPTYEAAARQAMEAIESAKNEAVVEGKNKAKEAWGQPIVSDQGVPSEARVTQQTETRRRHRGELSDVIRNMVFPKEGNAA